MSVWYIPIHVHPSTPQDAYDHHLRSVISHGKAPRLVLPPISHPHGASQLQPSSELYDLKRQLHHLEVQCRVTLQENERCVCVCVCVGGGGGETKTK